MSYAIMLSTCRLFIERRVPVRTTVDRLVPLNGLAPCHGMVGHVSSVYTKVQFETFLRCSRLSKLGIGRQQWESLAEVATRSDGRTKSSLCLWNRGIPILQ